MLTPRIGSSSGTIDSLARAAATAAQEDADAALTAVADALPKAGGTLTGNVTVSSGITVDGRDISSDFTSLDSRVTAAQSAADSSRITTFTETWPSSTNLKSSAIVYVSGTNCSWCSRQTSNAGANGGGAATWEIDSNGKLHWEVGPSTVVGSGNFTWTATNVKGNRILSRFRPEMQPTSGYLEWGVTHLALDSGETNHVATSSFLIGPTWNLASTTPSEMGTADIHHVEVVLSLSLGAVSILFRETRSGSTSTISSASYAGSLTTGVDLKLRMTSAGVITAYYRATGAESYTQLSSSVKLGDFQIMSFGVGTGNLSGTTDSGGSMNFRIDSCTHYYSP